MGLFFISFHLFIFSFRDRFFYAFTKKLFFSLLFSTLSVAFILSSTFFSFSFFLFCLHLRVEFKIFSVKTVNTPAVPF